MTDFEPYNLRVIDRGLNGNFESVSQCLKQVFRIDIGLLEQRIDDFLSDILDSHDALAFASNKFIMPTVIIYFISAIKAIINEDGFY